MLYFVSGPRLMRLDVRIQAPTVQHDFTAAFPGQTVSLVGTKYEGSPSLDARLWGSKADDQDYQTVALLDLASGAVTNLVPLDFSPHAFGLHISGRGVGRPGWAVISTHDGDSTSFTWMDKQVFLVELTPGGRVVRLAHHHSLVDPAQEHDYWAEPQASTNRDLTKVLFTTNRGRSGTDQVEMYMIELPADWTSRVQ